MDYLHCTCTNRSSSAFYNPRTEPATVEIKEERALYWLGQGAQPSDPVTKMLRDKGILDKLARLKRGETIEEILAAVGEEEPVIVEEEVALIEEESAPTAEEEVEAENAKRVRRGVGRSRNLQP